MKVFLLVQVFTLMTLEGTVSGHGLEGESNIKPPNQTAHFFVQWLLASSNIFCAEIDFVIFN